MPTVPAPPIRATRILGHCRRCYAQFGAHGPMAQQLASTWAASHLDPVIDLIDVAAAYTGDPLGTWRRRC